MAGSYLACEYEARERRGAGGSLHGSPDPTMTSLRLLVSVVLSFFFDNSVVLSWLSCKMSGCSRKFLQRPKDVM